MLVHQSSIRKRVSPIPDRKTSFPALVATGFYGVSLQSLVDLALRHGYTLVGVENSHWIGVGKINFGGNRVSTFSSNEALPSAEIMA